MNGHVFQREIVIVFVVRVEIFLLAFAQGNAADKLRTGETDSGAGKGKPAGKRDMAGERAGKFEDGWFFAAENFLGGEPDGVIEHAAVMQEGKQGKHAG